VRDAFRYALNCHCSQCRRVTGSAFKPFGGIEREQLTVTKGAETLSINGSPDNHDAFCRRCGSLLYSVVRDGAHPCRLQGAVVHHHRRPAAAPGVLAAAVDG
jgi:hypothetical protein